MGLMVIGLVIGLPTVSCGPPVVEEEDPTRAVGDAEAESGDRDPWTPTETPWGDPEPPGYLEQQDPDPVGATRRQMPGRHF